MNQISTYIHSFFQNLTIDCDHHDVHHYKSILEEAIDRFLLKETKETAYDVYSVFLECYGYTSETSDMKFIHFLEKMRGYEESASVLTQKQRDHFIHSVNVFLLGLAVYQCCPTYREAFYRACFKGELYAARHDTQQEEYLYRWGLTALCHDIGYPIEIITNQVNDFINYTTRLSPDAPQIHAHVEYDRFDLVNAIPEKVPKRAFISKFYNRNEECVYIDLLKPVDLLAFKLHQTLGVDLCAVKEKLDGYIADSGRLGRVDHGFFSAVILLKWYGYHIQVSDHDPDELYYPMLDIASAVLLHNFYHIALVANTKRPNAFNLGPLEPEAHPLAYMLMLCDELQEWNREAYGREDQFLIQIQSASIALTEGRMAVTYIITKGAMPEEFIGKKMGTLNTLLKLDRVFPGGISIGCEALALAPQPPQNSHLTLEQLEQLAIAIHNGYNATARRLHPEKAVKYPNFSDLPKEKKFYNFRSAMEYPDMLAKVGCEIRTLDAEDPDQRVMAFTPAEIEVLAECEHERWMRGRVERGWRYGEKKSSAEKTNPNMVPYPDLTDAVQEFDRDPARNIPALLDAIGLGVYRRAPEEIEHFTEEEIEKMARIIHNYYNERTALLHPKAQLSGFDELSEEKKEANRRQARGIPNKLKHIGCSLYKIGADHPGAPITSFSLGTIEMLARIEHDEWMGEKAQNGWSYGPRDESKKRNEYMVAYDSLTEPVKEYDRDTVRHMPDVVKACGYAIFPNAKKTEA
ncbi:MAG TPA: RyR domain-containing protein [Candidatus Limiplasma sp.]|nr:RyR domain-containing protein [Candidatus Limiplasma sp.]HPS80825.1 RyR domain-containing protein [Candidatus Limiplasma sp.]